MPSVLLVALSALVLLLGVVPAPARAAACTDPDPIARHYCELGGSASILGTPVGAPYVVGTGRAQNYSNGTIYWTAAAGAYEAHGLVGAHYRALGGPTGILGFPVTDELGTADGVGRYNHFQRGSIFFTPATGAHEVHGAIGSEWAALGYERSVLGYPVTDELGTGDGVGRYSGFERGAIYFTPATGAHEVHGAIMGTWAGLGFQRSVLGYPITDELGTADGVGRYNHFQRGSIFFTPATGAHEVHGAIGSEWAALGYERSVLGYPVTDELGTGDGVGRYSGFERGAIYFTPATGAHEVHGAIMGTWASLGFPRSVLGYPITDELGTADGVGRYNHFQRGSIFFTPATGAHEVHGAIGSEWAALGYERSVLGYPVTDELGTGDGVGRYSGFERGAIYFSPATGAHEVHGAIMGTWASLGFAGSVVGYPITDEYSVNGGRQSDFQGGFLRWTEATGVVRVAVIPPYQRVGTWVTRYRFSREYAGPNPPISPAQVDTMAAAGVHTIYIQAAADDPLYPGLLSPDLLGQFLTRAHAHGMQVVAWYLPHFTDVAADLRRMQAMADFRASGQAFDALGVDIEDRTIADPAARNAALVDFSTRLAAALPAVTLGAIVLPPVVTDVINPVYWPNFPWRQLSGLYQVWLPMAYWSNRTDPVYSDPYRYTSENVSRLRADLGEQCAAVSVIGGYGTAETPADYAAGARAAADQGSIGFSIFDWTTTPASVWPAVRGYSLRGC